MLRAFLKWTGLVFLVIESLSSIAFLLGLALNLNQAGRALGRISLGKSALELMLRLAIVVLLFFTYLFLRKLSQLPSTMTRQSALLSARAVRSSLLAAISLYALAAEWTTRVAEPLPLLSVWIISASAAGTVMISLILRSRFLSEANTQLRRDATDVRALGQWRKFTMLSMVLAMSVGLYGFALRMVGYPRAVEWCFFVGAAVLLFLWRPRLNNATSPPETLLSKPQTQ